MKSVTPPTRAQRLRLGIFNVGFWVIIAATILSFRATLESSATQIQPVWIWIIGLGGYLAVQGVFDWIGAGYLGSRVETNPEFKKQWVKGVALQTIFWTLLSALIILANYLGTGYCIACLLGILLLSFTQLICLNWVNGSSQKIDDPTDFQGKTFMVDCPEPTFTGGIIAGLGKHKHVIPENWKASKSLDLEIIRRNYMASKDLPFRAFLIVVAWNLVGVAIGDWLNIFDSNSVALTILYFSSWMTLWSFTSLLVLPSLSHSTVFAADQAAHQEDPESLAAYIENFPEVIDEDGHKNSFVQKIFYPIPSSELRLKTLDQRTSFQWGPLSRTNLFLSWATLNLTARSVHCNVGRPPLWIMPPTA